MEQLALHDRVINEILAARAVDSADRPFIHIGGVSLTYSEMYDAVSSVAKAFSDLGVGRGDRVVVMLPNRLEFLLSWFAPSLLGATVVPINPDWKGDTLAYILTDAEPTALVVDASLLDTVEPVLSKIAQLKAVVVCDGEAVAAVAGDRVRRITWSDLAGLGGSSELGEGSKYDDVMAVLYSSGTTGRPKGIMLPHAHVYSFGVNWINTSNFSRDDILFGPLSLFYMQPTILGVVPTLMVGAQMHIAERFSASRYWDSIRETKATIAHGQFTLIPLLLKEPPSRLDRQHDCTRIFIGKTNVEFESRFGVRILEIYGSTESNLVTYNPWDAPRAMSAGKAAPNFELRIVDDDDQELPAGTLGEIVFRPAEPLAISYGYYKQPGATLEAFRNLWFHLGDRGYVDEDGYLFYVDRKKDVIRRKGENISAQELERQINAHPAVSVCAVVPIPDEAAEEEVKAVVVLEAGRSIDAAALLEYLVDNLPKFMVPRYIEFIDALPMTPSMKIEKFRLREIGLTAQTWDGTVQGYVERS